jgi:phosphoglycerol transferase MdoB-like AlkP superfamily enzyme
MPMAEKDKLKFDSDEGKYVNSVHYADAKLFEFLQSAKYEKWFNNTLFVMMADHSHRSPRHWSMNQPEYRRIPMLLWGGVIKDEFKGYRNKKICSQIDFASTLLHQLEIPATRFKWSKNLFNPYTPEFAYFENSDGFGWVRDTPSVSPSRGEASAYTLSLEARDGAGFQYLSYSHTMNQYYFEQTKSLEEKNRLEKEGKSFLQVMFQEYTDY